MVALSRWLAGVVGLVCIALAVGCDSGGGSKPGASGTGSGGVRVQRDPGPDMPSEAEDHSTGPALSAEDQALADAQKICPVSGEELGGDMGPPVKLVVKGEPIFLCCKSCEKKVNADPDTYLAKVAELKKAKSDGSEAEAKKPDQN